MSDSLAVTIAQHINELCGGFPDRHVGGPGNHAATEYFSRAVSTMGFDVARSEFDCVDWEHGEVALVAGGERFEALVGPYSLPVDATAPLVVASTVEELETANLAGSIVLLHGHIAAGQLMPKNFIFYNPESHKRIIRIIEDGAPAAVIAATGRNPELVGDLYPFPLFEDADFDIPNAYMKDVDGERLLTHQGEIVTLRFESRRIPARAEHIVATKAGQGVGRVVVFGHIDSKDGTPGALDNATGVATLLALAHLLHDVETGPDVEIVPLNGEDYYAASGQMVWVGENESRMDDIILGMNVDAAGWAKHRTHVTTYGVPDTVAAIVTDAMEAYESLEEGPPWPMSDHGIFIHYGRPALAVTSEGVADLLATVAHTERDLPDLVDPGAVADIARFLRDLIVRMPG